jgi:hypothetical protein
MTITATTTDLPTAELDKLLTDWAWNRDEGTSETSGLELLDIDEDEAVARYGEDGNDRLCRLITLNLEYRVAYRQTWDCPEEGYCYGSCYAETDDGEVIAEVDFEGEDGLFESTESFWK